jgi:hypothetical protein
MVVVPPRHEVEALAIAFSVHSYLPFPSGSHVFDAVWIRDQITLTVRRPSSVLETNAHGTE